MVHRLLLVLLLLGVGLARPVLGQPIDAERKAFARVKASADKGDAQAQFDLGERYAEGDGVKRDLEKAVKWHRKAAEQGLARAEYQLGLDYLNGEGVKIDSREAVHWFQRAAEQDFTEAQCELAKCLIGGRGTVENAAEAVKWFRKAAAHGSDIAEYHIGSCYLQGIGVPKDIEEGIKWTQGAADKGVPAAQLQLGISYETGEGVPKDGVQAYKWFALAAAQDDEHSLDIKVRLAKLEGKLSKEEISQAQKMAKEFKVGQGTPITADHPGTSAKPGERTGAESPKTGHVNVKADPEDCEVFVDGSFVGNAPATLQLSEGTHVIEIKKTGYKDFKRELKVMAGWDLNLTGRLEKQ